MDAKEHSLIATETSGDDYFYPSAKSLRNPKKQGWLIKYKPGCFCDVWKRRWVVLQGGYIFKFERKDSKRPKGLPISVTETSASIERNTSDTDQYGKVLCISSISKKQVFATDDDEELYEWIEAIQKAKNDTIKQRLGHMEIGSEDAYAHRAGARLEKFKARIEGRDAALNQGRFGVADTPFG
mmetsp:Transcript_23506/g.37765  ORF Transcript_23506/g.37765 Transcript_23506/m.37765 type:complete len:183 (-) Transcript_23506:294-842(-)